MKHIAIAAAALLLVGCTEPLTTAKLVDQVKPGTVLITNQKDVSSGGIGTGFVIGENMIVTNNHVIEGTNNKLNVISPISSKKYEAEVIHTDALADIAVLRLKDWDSFLKEQRPVILDLGDSEQMDEGDKVVVIGHPWGLNWTVSEGVLSAKHRRAGPNPKFLDQVDAKIFQGNSGGPVFNEDGQVVCVSELMLTGEGGSYGFCIPSNLVKKILHDFDKFGEIRWRAMNISISLTEDGSYVILETIEPDGAAAKAGLKQGDKILNVFTSDYPEGKKIVKQDDLITALATLNGDEEVIRIVIDRNGDMMTLDVKTNYKTAKDYPVEKAK